MSDTILYSKSLRSSKPELPNYKGYLYYFDDRQILRNMIDHEESAAYSLWFHLAGQYSKSLESSKPELPKYKSYLDYFDERQILRRYKIDQEEIAADSLRFHLAIKRRIAVERARREVEIEAPNRTPIMEDDSQIDGVFRSWSGPDFLATGGMILLLAGFVLALFPASRAGGVLFPLGAALLAFTGYWARYRYRHLA